MRAIKTAFFQMLLFLRKDMMLFAACCSPVLIGIIFKFGIPAAEEILNRYIDFPLIRYYEIFDVLFALLTPLMFCFTASMIILEELDDNIAKYLLITPLNRRSSRCGWRIDYGETEHSGAGHWSGIAHARSAADLCRYGGALRQLYAEVRQEVRRNWQGNGAGLPRILRGCARRALPGERYPCIQDQRRGAGEDRGNDALSPAGAAADAVEIGGRMKSRSEEP